MFYQLVGGFIFYMVILVSKLHFKHCPSQFVFL